MTKKQDKPRQEFWDTSRGFIEWCTPEELRILRVMAASELENRIKEFSMKVDELELKAKVKKFAAIKKKVKK
jgi:hypothetical protein